MFLLIDGFWASGKSILKSLLDGHPKLKVSPGQEAVFSAFARNKKLLKKLSYKDLSIIRKILSDSYYYDLERYHLNNHSTVDWKFHVKLNFYQFETYWTKKVSELKNWNAIKIIEIIHTSLIKNFYNITYYKSNKSLKVFMEDNNFESHFFYLKNFKDSKLILISRDFGDVIASMINRKKKSNIYHTDKFDEINNFNYLIHKKFLSFKNENNKIIAKTLKKKFPGRVYICDFDKLIFNTEDEMRKICKFLKIKFNKILLKNTHFGKLTKRNDKKQILGKKIFEKKKHLSNAQIKLLNIIENKQEQITLASYISFIILKCKYLIYKIFTNVNNRIKKL